MATSSLRPVTQPSPRTGDVWNGQITPATRSELLREDSEAWTAVTGVLITIVTLGLVFGIAAVLWIELG